MPKSCPALWTDRFSVLEPFVSRLHILGFGRALNNIPFVIVLHCHHGRSLNYISFSVGMPDFLYLCSSPYSNFSMGPDGNLKTRDGSGLPTTYAGCAGWAFWLLEHVWALGQNMNACQYLNKERTSCHRPQRSRGHVDGDQLVTGRLQSNMGRQLEGGQTAPNLTMMRLTPMWNDSSVTSAWGTASHGRRSSYISATRFASVQTAWRKPTETTARRGVTSSPQAQHDDGLTGPSDHTPLSMLIVLTVTSSSEASDFYTPGWRVGGVPSLLSIALTNQNTREALKLVPSNLLQVPAYDNR